jgi:hypothetical protein
MTVRAKWLDGMTPLIDKGGSRPWQASIGCRAGLAMQSRQAHADPGNSMQSVHRLLRDNLDERFSS